MARAADLPPPPTFDLVVDTRPLALFLDFDGTLIDIAESPDAIKVSSGLADRLAALSDRLSGRLALISGRSVDNLEAHLGPLRLARAGSHGADVRNSDGLWLSRQPVPLEAKICRKVQAFAASTGAVFEFKPHGAALHWRSNPEIEERCVLFMHAIAARHGLAVKQGKLVAELVRAGADKGAAVRIFMAVPPFTESVPVFVGDDVTDEDGFAEALHQGGFAVTVGPRDSRLAAYGLADPAAVRHWLGL